MDVYTYAMDMEKESERYYRELGQNCGNVELDGVFGLLADEEARHYDLLKEMRAKSDLKEVPSTLLSDVKTIFQQIRAKGEFSCSLDQAEMYEKAQTVEEKTKAHYLDRAERAASAAEKALFERLAGEEQKHWTLLDNIIELVSRPEQWIEDAEFTHFEDY